MASSDSGPNQLVFIFYVELNRWLPGNNIYNHAVLKAILKKKKKHVTGSLNLDVAQQ